MEHYEILIIGAGAAGLSAAKGHIKEDAAVFCCLNIRDIRAVFCINAPIAVLVLN